MPAPVDDVGIQARLEPGRLAAVDFARGDQWSYATFDADIARTVRVLGDFGIGQGDRIVAIARNRVLLAILHLACARAGVIYVPLN